MAKLMATEVANRVADACLQFYGGYGYAEDAAISRIYRDTRLATIVGGSSEIQREVIAQAALDGADLGSGAKPRGRPDGLRRVQRVERQIGTSGASKRL